MSTKKCPRLYKFLAYDEFDMEKVQSDIDRDIPEAYHYTREVIEDIFQTKVKNLREYFDLSDDLISVYGGSPNHKSAHNAINLHPKLQHSENYIKREL
jgi:hypothetical protein